MKGIKPNARTNSHSKFTATIKRKRSKRIGADDLESELNNIDSILTEPSNRVSNSDNGDDGGDSEQSTNDDDINSGTGIGSGRIGRSDRGNGRNRNSGKSDGDRSNNTDTIPRKRGRRSRADRIEEIRESLDVPIEEASRIYEEQYAPRRVKKSELLPEGIEGSVLLFTTLFETTTDLLAVTMQKPYIKLQKSEAKELSEAMIGALEAMPASMRKRFDKLMKNYIPYWHLASTVAKLAYPRWIIYQYEKEMSNVNTTPSPSKSSNETQATHNDSGNGFTSPSEGWPGSIDNQN